MSVYLYDSVSHLGVKAFTFEATDANLPQEFGPWRPSGGGTGISVAKDSGPLEAILNRDGYFLVR